MQPYALCQISLQMHEAGSLMSFLNEIVYEILTDMKVAATMHTSSTVHGAGIPKAICEVKGAASGTR